LLRVISIHRGRPTDRAAIENLLEANGLPTAGFDLAAATAVVAREESGAREIVGCAAVEPYGSVGLLRSVCVAPDFRSAGLGRRLVAQAEAIARGLGIGRLYLLTDTAGDWFPRLGYEPVGKGTAPAQLLASPEFTGACPESALLLRKILDHPPELG
jgi:amino-acid N-acetyltransferase